MPDIKARPAMQPMTTPAMVPGLVEAGTDEADALGDPVILLTGVALPVDFCGCPFEGVETCVAETRVLDREDPVRLMASTNIGTHEELHES